MHPMLVHFPIALLALSVVTDVIAFLAHVDSLRNVGWWALVGAAGGAAATVPRVSGTCGARTSRRRCTCVSTGT